jgi:NADH-quinone oxidoreductase subunit L
VGALALAAVPPMSGLFSKDEILAFTLHRGGWYTVLAVAGYVGALLTAFYAFRMVFRVFFGDPVPEAESLERGELAHGEHANPMTGEKEDTEVGFPGPEHHIAEREGAMKLAMIPLAILAVIGGVVGIPGATDTLEHFLEPTFEESAHHEEHPSESAEYAGLAVGAAVAIAGIGLAYLLYVSRAGVTLQLRDRLRGLHDFLEHKWYFDELYDALFVRPTQAFGRFGRTVIESAFVQGFLVGGTVSVVRSTASAARAIQSGYLRAYAFLLLIGVGGLVLYFLIAST